MSRVVASQLSADLTKKLILTDPHRIKSTAESISVQFHVPVGVQLIVIYITDSEYRKLTHESGRAQSAFNNNNNTILPFQIKRKMKRDKSLIFSHIPEEEVAPPVKTTNFNRPTHLPLRFKNLTSKDIPESGFNSINFDETDSFPDFIGKTSVVSTPMTENKILHGDFLSICVNTNDELIEEKTSSIGKEKGKEKKMNGIDKDIKLPKPDYTNYIINPYYYENRRNSLKVEKENLINKIAKNISLRPFGGFGLKKLPKSIIDENFDDDELYDDNNKKLTRTITDPTYPVFSSDGKPISKCLFQTFVEKQISEIEVDSQQCLMNSGTKDKEGNNVFDGFEMDLKTTPKHEKKMITTVAEIELVPEKKTIQNRKSLSLPIKSLNLEPINQSDQIIATQSTVLPTNIFDSPARRKKLSGLQLTPLMNKLTILAMNDERSSGFSSWDTTPGCSGMVNPDICTPTVEQNKSFSNNFNRRRTSLKCDDIVEESSHDTLQKVELFVCGQQNMTLFLLLEEKAGEKHDLVQAMVC